MEAPQVKSYDLSYIQTVYKSAQSVQKSAQYVQKCTMCTKVHNVYRSAQCVPKCTKCTKVYKCAQSVSTKSKHCTNLYTLCVYIKVIKTLDLGL